MSEPKIRSVGVVLFEGFELLDVYGPLQVWNCLSKQFRVVTVGEKIGPVSPSRGPDVAPAGPQTLVARSFADCEPPDVVFIPSGWGTRRQVANPAMLGFLRAAAQRAEFVASVCTGSAVLAAAGILDGKRATSNKAAFSWVRTQGSKVQWIPQARWVVDGKFWTSSGVSAGIDMALALLARIAGDALARTLAKHFEYEWHDDPAWDPFAKLHGLV
jgi:putative intracellular protease/amidase